MTLNDLLLGKGFDPRQVLVFRHRPWEPELNKVLPWLAAERQHLFNAYQQSHGPRVEKAMQIMLGKGYVASFIRHAPGKALFIGLYAIGQSKPLSRRAFREMPANVELRKFGAAGFRAQDPRSSILRFDLKLTDFYREWKGKLVVRWPPPERSWWRRAHRNEFPVGALLEESALDKAMPSWQDITLSWQDLGVLPTPWKAAVSQWRGIYYIFDVSIGKGYVAYGRSNLLGKWVRYRPHSCSSSFYNPARVGEGSPRPQARAHQRAYFLRMSDGSGGRGTLPVGS